MDKKDNYILIDEFVEIHNRALDVKTSDLFFRREKLKTLVQKGKKSNSAVKIKFTKLIYAYSLMIIVFTFFSFLIINHFDSNGNQNEKDELNFSLFLEQTPGSFLITFRDEVKL